MNNTYTHAENHRALTIRLVKLIKADLWNTEMYSYLSDKRYAIEEKILAEGLQ